MMLTKCFKEWATVCDALARGRQTVIVRKGGILEERAGFKLEADEFLLFPSLLHQNAAGLQPGVPLVTSDPVLTHVARVEAARTITTLETLRTLRPFHVYSDALLEERFHRWEVAGVHALIVRVSKLPQPVPVPAAEEYEGCKSWFDLRFGVDPTGATPVIPDDEFSSIQSRVLRHL